LTQSPHQKFFPALGAFQQRGMSVLKTPGAMAFTHTPFGPA